MKKLLIPFLIFCYIVTNAQSPVHKIGNISRFDIDGPTVRIVAENAFVTITAYSENIIRVRMDKQKLKEDFSYAVAAQPAKSHVRIAGNEKEITVTTDSLKAVIQAKPFAIAFYNNEGNLINTDEPGSREKKSVTLDMFNAGLNDYFNRRFTEAAVSFRKVVDLNPQDIAAKRYLEHAARFMVTGVPDDWEGTEEMREK